MIYLKKYEEIKLKNNLDNIFFECKYFINDLKKCDKGSFIYRGVNKKVDIEKFKSNLKYREPINMRIDIHEKLNKKFHEKFGWNVRNGVFSIGKKTFYGIDSYLIFPIGKYEIVWSPEIIDLYGEIEDVLDDILDDAIYKYDNNKNIISEKDDMLIFKNIFKFEDFFEKYKTPIINEKINDFVKYYKSGDLNNAIKSENEISINCKNYYLINIEYKKELIKYIWN